MILFGGAFSRIPVSVLESAELDGVTWYQEAFKIIVPMVWPTVSMLMMMSIASVFGSTGDVFLITRGKKGTQTIACWMYLQVFNNPGVEYSNAYNYMSAIGMNLTVISVGLALGLRKLSNKLFKDVQY
jgi:ABC-type sugar transport system permease subunit